MQNLSGKSDYILVGKAGFDILHVPLLKDRSAKIKGKTKVSQSQAIFPFDWCQGSLLWQFIYSFEND